MKWSTTVLGKLRDACGNQLHRFLMPASSFDQAQNGNGRPAWRACQGLDLRPPPVALSSGSIRYPTGMVFSADDAIKHAV
jgi:hypothetical protein